MAVITVLGAGYVGLTTAACLAHLGHRVHTVDIDTPRVRRLHSGEVDLLEPGLTEMMHEQQRAGRLTFTDTADDCLTVSDAVFLCLPTPPQADGSADLTTIDDVIPVLRRHLAHGSQLVVKSTVPPGTHRHITGALQRPDLVVCSNPEFLREGHALHDWMHPHRIVVGTDDPEQAHHVIAFFEQIDAPRVITDPTSAELIKYAANTFLALKVTFANTMAELSEQLGANVTDVVTALGHDPRIGPDHLRPGPGWGGPCLVKDTHALLSSGGENTVALGLLDATVEVNAHHQRRIAAVVEQLLPRPLLGARITILGLTFKRGTNDLRDSPAVSVAASLHAHEAHVRAHDPAVDAAKANELELTDQLTLAASAGEAVVGADAVVVLTDWPEFTALPWQRLAHTMRGMVVLDTRGCLDPVELAEAGLHLHLLGHAVPHQE